MTTVAARRPGRAMGVVAPRTNVCKFGPPVATCVHVDGFCWSRVWMIMRVCALSLPVCQSASVVRTHVQMAEEEEEEDKLRRIS